MSRLIRQGLPALLVAVAALFSGSAQRAEEGAQPLGKEQQNVLYALGVAAGQQLKQFALSAAEFEVLSQGMRDAVLERELRADPFELRQELALLGEKRQIVRIEKERTASLAFVAEAAREEGAVQTRSGSSASSLQGVDPRPSRPAW
jgi:hypothetical protein